jgi:putative SOS response-associated peptidase YedK
MTYLMSMQEFASCLASHASSALPARASFVAEGHDRMPVLLKPEQFDHWLSGNMTVDELKPIENDYLQRWPVSKRVNSSKADSNDPTLIDPAKQAA